MPVETHAAVGEPSEIAFTDIGRRDRRRLRRTQKRFQREILVAERLAETRDKIFPDEDERLAQFDPILDQTRKGKFNLNSAVDFAKLWNNNPPFIRRRIEMNLRDAAKDAGHDPGPLPRRKHSSLEANMTFLGQGKIPATLEEADRRIEEETDPATVESLTSLRDQLDLAKKTKGNRSSGVVVHGGLGVGWGPGGLQANIGAESQPGDPAEHRKYDVFVAVPGVKVIAPMITPVLGFRKHGLEKSVSAAGVGVSKHPYLDEQVKANPPFIGLAAGKQFSGFKLEAPLALLAPLANLVGADEIASYIHSLGLYGYFIKPQLVVNFQDERLRPVQDRVAKISARMPRIPERVKFWKKKQPTSTSKEVFEETAREKVFEPV